MTEEELAWAEATGLRRRDAGPARRRAAREMGFGREDAAAALQASGGDVERATQALLGSTSAA